MSHPDPRKVAQRYLEQQVAKTARVKTAGEVVHRKDTSGDGKLWSKQGIPPEKRKLVSDFNYSPKNAKPLAEVLRSASAAMGHAISAHNKFFRIKSSKVSPDGSLGGLGGIMTISDIRTQLSNIVDSLSRVTDTLFDEIKAPHWSVMSRQDDSPEGQKVKELLQNSAEIREDPSQWADEELEEEFED